MSSSGPGVSGDLHLHDQVEGRGPAGGDGGGGPAGVDQLLEPDHDAAEAGDQAEEGGVLQDSN